MEKIANITRIITANFNTNAKRVHSAHIMLPVIANIFMKEYLRSELQKGIKGKSLIKVSKRKNILIEI